MSTRRILIGIFAVLIIGAGLVTGVYMSDQRRAERINAFFVVQPKKEEPNFNTYEISPPSRGGIIITKDVALTISDNDAFALLSKSDATDVKTGQRVLLYDAGGNVLEKIGKVFAVTPEQNDKINIHIKMDADQTVPNNLVTKGKIITGDNPNARRLPLPAVITNTGKKSVWEVSRKEDGTYEANLKPANIAHETNEYVVIAENADSTNIFILNPDDALKEGQVINVKEILYAGPALTEDERIIMAIKERYNVKSKYYKDKRYRENLLPPSRKTENTSCTPEGRILDDFIKNVRDISQENEDQLGRKRHESEKQLEKFLDQ